MAVPSKFAIFARLPATALLVFFALACSYQVKAASPAAVSVSVNPDSAYNGDYIEITLNGFAADYLVPAGSVTLAGQRVPIPGVFGYRGTRPKVDSQGNVTFVTQVPVGVAPGVQPLAVARIDGSGEVTTTMTVLAAELTVSPNPVVPNQSVIVRGADFSAGKTRGGAGPLGVHQITGIGYSSITLGGRTLQSMELNYPINLDSDGRLFATLTIPINDITLAGGVLELIVTDSVGRTGKTLVQMSASKLSVEPVTSGRGSTIKVAGSGFVASGDSYLDAYPVAIDYAGSVLDTLVPDATGRFETEITVPLDKAVQSVNSVTATLQRYPGSWTAVAKHTVSGPEIHVSPASAPEGGSVTVTGNEFLGFITVSSLTVGGALVLPSPAPHTAYDGTFSVLIIVPDMEIGTKAVWATVGGVKAVTGLRVTTGSAEPTPVPQPTPTQTPAPTPVLAIHPSAGLEPLGGNLLRLWSHDDAMGTWSFYDPDPVFAGVNTLTELFQDHVYWIFLKQDQAVTLNGRDRRLIKGGNFIHW